MVYDDEGNAIHFRGGGRIGWTMFTGAVLEGSVPVDENEIPADVKLAMKAVRLVMDMEAGRFCF